jgi:chromosome segregation ATPase
MRQAADEIEKERAAVDGHIRLIEVLEDEVARLRAELAAERERATNATKAWECAIAERNEMQTERDKLRDALERVNGWGFAIQHLTAVLKHANDVLKGDGDE